MSIEPPEPGTLLFFDENWPQRLVDLCREHLKESRGMHLFDRFPSGADDAEFLPYVGARGHRLLLVTKDCWSLRKSPHLLRIMHDHRVRAVFFRKKLAHGSLFEQARLVFRFWNAMCDAARSAGDGAVFQVKRRNLGSPPRLEPWHLPRLPPAGDHNAN